MCLGKKTCVCLDFPSIYPRSFPNNDGGGFCPLVKTVCVCDAASLQPQQLHIQLHQKIPVHREGAFVGSKSSFQQHLLDPDNFF